MICPGCGGKVEGLRGVDDDPFGESKSISLSVGLLFVLEKGLISPGLLVILTAFGLNCLQYRLLMLEDIRLTTNREQCAHLGAYNECGKRRGFQWRCTGSRKDVIVSNILCRYKTKNPLVVKKRGAHQCCTRTIDGHDDLNM